MKKIFILPITFLFFLGISFSQEENTLNFQDIGSTNFSIGYGVEFPFGDMADRFSNNLKFTIGADRITSSNWIFGVEFAYMFGDTVKEDVLSKLRIDNGEVLGSNNEYADVFMRQRGLFLGINVGRIFPLSKKSKSGIRVTNAFGVLQHNVRVVDDARSLPQIEGDYIKGYDRMTRGIAMRQFIGYQHISEDKRINFIIGLEFTEGFTKHVRNLDYDTGLVPDTKTRFDGLISLKAAFVLPFFDDFEDEEVFY